MGGAFIAIEGDTKNEVKRKIRENKREGFAHQGMIERACSPIEFDQAKGKYVAVLWLHN